MILAHLDGWTPMAITDALIKLGWWTIPAAGFIFVLIRWFRVLEARARSKNAD